MWCQLLRIWVIILAATQAAPTAIANPLGPRKSTNHCGDSTFYDQTTEGSALVADCKALVDKLKGTFPD
jgi:hypothetical protein